MQLTAEASICGKWTYGSQDPFPIHDWRWECPSQHRSLCLKGHRNKGHHPSRQVEETQRTCCNKKSSVGGGCADSAGLWIGYAPCGVPYSIILASLLCKLLSKYHQSTTKVQLKVFVGNTYYQCCFFCTVHEVGREQGVLTISVVFSVLYMR